MTAAESLLRQALDQTRGRLAGHTFCSLLQQSARASTVTLAMEQSTIHAALAFGGAGPASAGLLSRDATTLAEQVIRSGARSVTLKLVFAVLAIAVMAVGAGAAIQMSGHGFASTTETSQDSGSDFCGSHATAQEPDADLLTLERIIRSKGPVQALAFTRDGKLLASVSRGSDQPVRLWDRKAGTEYRRALGRIPPSPFSPDGRFAAAAEEGAIWLWKAALGPVRP